jgi:N-acyl-D-amino-acid deacylase
MPGWLLRGGTVVDGTGRPGFRADLRIAGDRIRAIGRLRPEPGETVVDCGHLVVAPGFIDSHSHADSGLADDPQAATQVRQGITTAVVGQDGGSRWPMESLWDELVRIRPNLNLASLVGHGTLRTLALGGDARGNPDPAQLRRMRALAIEALRAGACGISSGLEYEPGLHSNENELVAVMETAAIFGVVHASHARDEEDDALAAFDELLSVARRTGSAVHVSHIKLGSKAVWGKAGDVLLKLDRLRKDGIPVSADVYPWGYWQSTIKTLVPPERLGDRDAWLAGLDAVGGPGRVRIAVFTPDPTWQETTLDQLARRLSRAPVDIALDMVRRTQGGAGRESVVVEAMLGTDIARFATSPWVAFSSDGGLRGAHPRGAGSFPRVLGRYVREKRLLPLEEAVRKMTSLPASVYGIRGRGRLVPGAFADIVCFDPATVVENSTIAAPLAPPRGVVGVWVNGVPVVRRGEVVDGRSGRGLRRI